MELPRPCSPQEVKGPPPPRFRLTPFHKAGQLPGSGGRFPRNKMILLQILFFEFLGLLLILFSVSTPFQSYARLTVLLWF